MPLVGPAFPRWDDSDCPGVFNGFHNLNSIIALVSEHIRGLEALYQIKSLRAVIAFTARKDKPQRAAQTVNTHMDLRGQSASGTPQSRTPVPPFPVAA